MDLDLILASKHQHSTETKAPTAAHALHDHIVDASVVVSVVVVGTAVVVVVLNRMVVVGRVVEVVVLGQMVVVVGRVVVVVVLGQMVVVGRVLVVVDSHHPPSTPHPPPMAPTYPTHQTRTSKEGCDIDHHLSWEGTQTTCYWQSNAKA